LEENKMNPLSRVSSEGGDGAVVVVGVNARHRSKRAGEWWWWAWMPIVARNEQGSGGGGRECPSSLETSRAVVVVGMNACRHSFRAVVVARRGVAVVGMNSFVVRFEQGSGGGQNIPSVSHFERGRGTCIAAVGRVVATLDVPFLMFRGRDTLPVAALMFGVTRRVLPLFATSKMVFHIVVPANIQN
jgi:hypothetical protein